MSVTLKEFSGGKPVQAVSQQDFLGGQAPSSVQAPQAPQPQDQGSYLGQTLRNAPGSLGGLLSGIGGIIAHPIETAKNVGKLAIGTAGKLIPGTPEAGSKMAQYEALAGGVGSQLKQRYGGASNIAETFKTDPFGTAADVAGLLTGAGGLAKTAGTLAKSASLVSKGARIAEIGNAIDPFVRAGELLKGGLNVAGKVAGRVQPTLGGTILSGVPSEALSGIQDASAESSRLIWKAMQDSNATRKLVTHVENSIKGMDNIVNEVSRATARNITTKVPTVGLVDKVISNLNSIGVKVEPIYEKLRPTKEGLDIIDVSTGLPKRGKLLGYRVLEASVLGAKNAQKAIDNTLMAIQKLEDQKRISTIGLWDNAQQVSNNLKSIEKLNGYDKVFQAVHGTLTGSMPQQFWKKVQSQNEVRQLTEAMKKALSESQLEGYGANPIIGGQRVEGRLGQLFGKGKSVTRENILKFESTMRDQLAELRRLTGQNVEELVANGLITREAADAMLSPEIMDRALAHAVMGTAPTAFRSMSIVGGSIGGLLGATVNPIGAAGLGLTLAIPRVEGMLAYGLGKAKRAGGLGAGLAKTRPVQALGKGITTANQLRALLQKR